MKEDGEGSTDATDAPDPRHSPLRPVPFIPHPSSIILALAASLPRVDLHTHTVVSDGTLTPTQLVQAAAHAKLVAIAVTDHDHVGGLSEARAAGARVGVEVVSGIELSCEHEGRELHLLGYLVDERDRAFLAKLEELRNRRDRRNAKILQKLGALGMRVAGADVAREAMGAGSVGRPAAFHGWIVPRPP